MSGVCKHDWRLHGTNNWRCTGCGTTTDYPEPATRATADSEATGTPGSRKATDKTIPTETTNPKGQGVAKPWELDCDYCDNGERLGEVGECGGCSRAVGPYYWGDGFIFHATGSGESVVAFDLRDDHASRADWDTAINAIHARAAANPTDTPKGQQAMELLRELVESSRNMANEMLDGTPEYIAAEAHQMAIFEKACKLIDADTPDLSGGDK